MLIFSHQQQAGINTNFAARQRKSIDLVGIKHHDFPFIAHKLLRRNTQQSPGNTLHIAIGGTVRGNRRFGFHGLKSLVAHFAKLGIIK